MVTFPFGWAGPTPSLTPPPAWIRAAKIEIAKDINSLLGETVNEGETYAEVATGRDLLPLIDCRVRAAKADPNVLWLFCNVNFRVKTMNGAVVPQMCRLSFAVKNRDLRTLIRGPNAQIDDCLSSLNTAE